MCEKPIQLIIGTDTLGIVMPENIPIKLEQTLKSWTNQGYPFAELVLSHYETNRDTILLAYRIEPRESVTVDTVVFGNFSPSDVNRLMRIMREDLTGLYQHDRVLRAQERLQESPWLTVDDHHDISGNALRFYVEKVEDFSFDGLLSYQSQAGGIIGQVDIGFVNFLGLGRRADFSWYHPSKRTNRMMINWQEAYLFNTGFSSVIQFRQEHEDTLYVMREGLFELIWQNRTLDIGMVISQETIYTTEAGDMAGIVSGTRHVTALNARKTKRKNPQLTYMLYGSAGIRTGKDSLQYPIEYNGEITWIQNPYYLQGKLLGGQIFSQGNITDYQRFRLGGGTFLRGALFEQYRTDGYVGGTLEGGIQDGTMKAGLFLDWAFLQGISDPLFHVGTSLTLPTGTSHLKIFIGFNVREPLSQGKIHIGWTF